MGHSPGCQSAAAALRLLQAASAIGVFEKHGPLGCMRWCQAGRVCADPASYFGCRMRTVNHRSCRMNGCFLNKVVDEAQSPGLSCAIFMPHNSWTVTPQSIKSHRAPSSPKPWRSMLGSGLTTPLHACQVLPQICMLVHTQPLCMLSCAWCYVPSCPVCACVCIAFSLCSSAVCVCLCLYRILLVQLCVIETVRPSC